MTKNAELNTERKWEANFRQGVKNLELDSSPSNWYLLCFKLGGIHACLMPARTASREESGNAEARRDN